MKIKNGVWRQFRSVYIKFWILCRIVVTKIKEKFLYVIEVDNCF